MWAWGSMYFMKFLSEDSLDQVEMMVAMKKFDVVSEGAALNDDVRCWNVDAFSDTADADLGDFIPAKFIDGEPVAE